MNQIGFRRHDDIGLLFDGGRRAEEIFQNRDTAQNGQTDGLFDIVFFFIDSEDLFLAECEGGGTGEEGSVAQFGSGVSAFNNALEVQGVIEDHVAGFCTFAGEAADEGIDTIIVVYNLFIWSFLSSAHLPL